MLKKYKIEGPGNWGIIAEEDTMEAAIRTIKEYALDDCDGDELSAESHELEYAIIYNNIRYNCHGLLKYKHRKQHGNNNKP